jgi:hypothetical protein
MFRHWKRLIYKISGMKNLKLKVEEIMSMAQEIMP